MSDPLELEHPTAFGSVLRWLGRPGYAVRNLIKGNATGAKHQAMDFITDPIRALIPGDQSKWQESTKDDYTEASDLVGGMDPGLKRTAVDVAGDVITNPLSLLSFPASGGVKLAGKLFAKEHTLDPLSVLGKGYSSIKRDLPDTARDALDAGERKVRRVFGAERLSPEAKDALNTANSTMSAVNRAESTHVKQLLQGTTQDERHAIGEVMHNLLRDTKTGKPKQLLDVTDSMTPSQRVDLLVKAKPNLNADRLRTLVEGVGKYHADQFRSAAGTGFGGSIFTDGPGIENYFPRHFSGVRETDVGRDALGRANAIKSRKLGGPADVLDFLTHPDNAKVALEFDAAKVLAKRAENSGALAKKAAVGKALVGDEFKLADPKQRASVAEAIEAMRHTDPESAAALHDAFNGLPARGPILGALAKMNRLFKPASVYGVVIPKVGSIIRNRISAIPQFAATPGAGHAAMKAANPASIVGDVLGGLDDGLREVMGHRMLAPGEMTKSIDLIEHAFKQSGGVAANAIKLLEQTKPELAHAVKLGVMDSFVSSEELAKSIASSASNKKGLDLYNLPGHFFRGVEERMRLSGFLDLVKSGKSPEEAAQLVKDALYDYASSSAENRTLRDLVPFAQFSAKAIPQQAKWLSKNPAVAVGLAGLYGQRSDEPVPDYIANQTSIPLGNNSKGERLYATGLGLPHEALNTIPNLTGASIGDLGRQLEVNVIGQSQPLLKSIYGVVAGHDPFFQSKPGSYTKVPLFGDQGSAGSAYNMLAGTGAIQPVDSLLRSLDGLGKDQPLDIKLLDQLSGARIAAVDENKALNELLTKALDNNPDIQSYRGFYADKSNVEAQDLLKQLQEVKRKIKERRAAEASSH